MQWQSDRADRVTVPITNRRNRNLLFPQDTLFVESGFVVRVCCCFRNRTRGVADVCRMKEIDTKDAKTGSLKDALGVLRDT